MNEVFGGDSTGQRMRYTVYIHSEIVMLKPWVGMGMMNGEIVLITVVVHWLKPV